jgi:hypothetical protein
MVSCNRPDGRLYHVGTPTRIETQPPLLALSQGSPLPALPSTSRPRPEEGLAGETRQPPADGGPASPEDCTFGQRVSAALM